MTLDEFIRQAADDCVNARYYPKDIGMCDGCGDEEKPRRIGRMGGCDGWLCDSCRASSSDDTKGASDGAV